MYWIRVAPLRNAQPGVSLGEQAVHQVDGKLLGLVVTGYGELHPAVVTEIVVVAHLAGQESVGAGSEGHVGEKSARSAAQGDTLDRTAEEGVMGQRGDTERLLHLPQESTGLHGAGQSADHAAAALKPTRTPERLKKELTPPGALSRLVCAA